MHFEQPVSSFPSRNILVVDDDSEIRSLTRTFLEHEGYNVFTCENADRAIHLFKRSKIDLLITDYSMPNRSGMDLAREAKAIRPTLPVLIVSGMLLEQAQLELMRIRNWNFLPKPFSLPKLLSEVHRILAQPLAKGSATLTA
jgi:DNA-binding NtrC family response regulator